MWFMEWIFVVYIDKDKVAYECAKWIEEYGYWVTLNSKKSDRIKFEQDLILFANWLNDYCYGKQYERKAKRLKIVACIETGKANEGLHSHLVVTHANDTDRTFAEINAFVRKRWYKLNNLGGSVFGTMVDVQPIGDAQSRISYAAKDVNSPISDGCNIVYL